VPEIEAVAWVEVFDHIEAIYHSRAEEMSWETAAASFPHTDKKGRRDINRSIRKYRTFDVRAGSGSSKKAQSYDAMNPEARLLAVGQSLAQGGDEWLRRRPYHAEWLEEQGISPEVAVARYNEWATALADGDGWVERGITEDGSVVDG